jgi:hypothetical protein
LSLILILAGGFDGLILDDRSPRPAEREAWGRLSREEKNALEKGNSEMNGSEESRKTATEERKKSPAFGTDALWRTWSSDRTARKIATILSARAILTVVGPCTLTHQFGPYYGKIVDADTGAPLGGAVVQASFYTEA